VQRINKIYERHSPASEFWIPEDWEDLPSEVLTEASLYISEIEPLILNYEDVRGLHSEERWALFDLMGTTGYEFDLLKEAFNAIRSACVKENRPDVFHRHKVNRIFTKMHEKEIVRRQVDE
jgi:hypothetical protein